MRSHHHRAVLLGMLIALPCRGAIGQTSDSKAQGPVQAPLAVVALPPVAWVSGYDSASVFRVVPTAWKTSDLRVVFLTPRSLVASRWSNVDAYNAWLCAGSASARASPDSLAVGSKSLGPPEAIDRPWADFDSATSNRAFIGLQIDSPAQPVSTCYSATSPATIRAGIQMIGGGVSRVTYHYLRSATVQYQGRLLAPLATARTLSSAIVPDGTLLHTPPASLRSYFSPDQFQPDNRGRFGDAVVIVATADAGRIGSLTQVLPDSVLSGVWREFLPWRLAALDSGRRVTNLPNLRPAADTGYAPAFRKYESGNVLGAANSALARRERVRSDRAGPSDVQFADLLLGSAFLSYGDSVAGREEYADALRSAPCLQLDQHPAFDLVLTQLRSESARCTTIPLQTQWKWGLLIPGGGQWVQGDHPAGAAIAAITVTLFAASFAVHESALRTYHRYGRDVSSVPDGVLDQANSFQHTANGIALVAVATWVGAAVKGVLTQVAHTKRVLTEQQYDSAASVKGAGQ